MEEKRWSAYLDAVLSHVKFKYDHDEIRQELAAHLEDLREELLAEGLDEAAADYMAVEYMGNAAEIGQALDREHGAILGWIWRAARAIVILLLVCNIPAAITLGENLLFGGREAYEPSTDAALLWQMELDKSYPIYDDTLLLEDLYYYADGTLELFYRTKRNPFARSIDWSLTVSLDVLDAEGNSVRAGGGGYKGGGYLAAGCDHLDGVPADAKELKIYCGNMRFTVDLETGEVAEDA